jgi:hypothetical protein
VTRSVTVEVIVPTFRRPLPLAACLRALRVQTLEPERVLVVARRHDEETHDVVAREDWGALHLVEVERPGVVAALAAGVAVSTADVIAFTDDDATPSPRWLELLLDHLAQPDVVAAGGRDVIPGETQPRRRDVGLLTRFGRLVGNHHLGIGSARDVDVLKGVNMAFRAERLALPAPGVLLGEGAEVHFEPLVCSFAASGGRIVYDPAIEVDHPRVARAGVGRAGRPSDGDVRAAAHNLLVATSALGTRRVLRQTCYCVLVGSRATPGLGRALLAVARGEPEVVPRLLPSLTGFALALRRLRAGVPQPAMITAAELRERRPVEVAA